MTAQSNIVSAPNWCALIAHALHTVTVDDDSLYAGDDRRRMARQHAARYGHVRRAAVLIPIVDDDEPYIVLTERSRTLRAHPGQISFPGGSVEADDAGVQAAALRESQEEIGLDPAKVQVLGQLPDYVTGTGFNIAPIVGWVAPDARFSASSDEVERVLSVPLQYATDAEHFRRESMTIKHNDYRFHVIEYQNNYVWGATAAMLYGLCESIDRASATRAASSMPADG